VFGPEIKKENKKPGFAINRGKGFQVTFENGYTVSVQFGLGSYSKNKGQC